MTKPPREIDGATVLEWAWSGSSRFGVLRYESGEIAAEVFGLAICRYLDEETIYRFSCNSKWETVQDSVYRTIDEAKDCLPDQYREVTANWQVYE